MTNEATFTYQDLIAIAGSDAENIPRHLVVSGVSTDTRTLVSGNAFIALVGENFDGHTLLKSAVEKGASLIVVERAPVEELNVPVLVVPSTLQCLGSFAWHHRRRFSIPVVAIGGAAGKTSTKDLLAHVLSSTLNVLKTPANNNNRIGTPHTLLQLTADHEVAVIEIGTNEPGEIEVLCAMVQPTHGLITNIGKEHLEKLIDLNGVEREETALFDWINDHHGLAFVNADDDRLAPYASEFTRCITFAVETGADVHPTITFDEQVRPIIHLVHGSFTLRAAMKIPGLAAAYNATCVLAVAWSLHIPADSVREALESYQPPDSKGYARMTVARAGRYTVLNDTYNANPASMVMALRTLSKFPAGRRIALLGDMRELGHQSVDEHIRIITEAKNYANIVLLFGDEFRLAAESIRDEAVILHQTQGGCAAHLIDIADDDTVLLIKGSRGMHMEHIIELLSPGLEPFNSLPAS